MRAIALTRSRRVETESQRRQVLAVLARTYGEEKGWVLDVDGMFPPADLERADLSWFLATRGGEPVGVIRVVYDPQLGHYASYGLEGVDPNLDVAAYVARNKLVEIGRFAVLPERRSVAGIAVSLMRAATREIVQRGHRLLVTDVFENDPNSPLGFHTRILGFHKVATHEHGELLHKGRRITLMVDTRDAYLTMKRRGHRFFRLLTRGWTPAMHRSLA